MEPTLPVAQCDEVNKYLGRNDCCNQPRPAACNHTGWPPFEAYNFLYIKRGTPLDYTELRTEIACKSGPVIFQWVWPGGGSHVMVATGFDINGGNLIFYNDPAPTGMGSYAITNYGDYVSIPGHHTHGSDYYDIRPKPAD